MVQRIRVATTSDAPPAVVYGLLLDPATWPTWSGLDSARLDTPGTEDPYGVGSVRLHVQGRIRGYDEVVGLVPGRQFSYRHLHGLPLREYRGDVELMPAGDGTAITWSARFRPRFPGSGWLWRVGLARMLTRMASGLADHAAAVAGTDR